MRRAQFDEASQIVRNIAGNPKFENTAGNSTIRTNLAPNPSFEGTGSAVTVRTNVCANPSMETSGSALVVRSNLIVNPSIEAGAGTSTLRTNLMPNPALAVNSTGYTTYGGGASYSATTMSRVAAAWSLSGWAIKLQGSDTSPAFTAEIGFGDYTLAVGTVVTASVYVIAGASRKARLRFRAIGGASGDTFSPDFTLNATSPTRMSFTYTIPAGATGVSVNIKEASVADPFGPADWIAASMVLIETTNGVLPYFDGTIPAGQNIAKYGASGLGQGGSVTLTTGVSYSGSTWSRAAVATGTGSGNARITMDLADLIPGQTYTTAVTLANDQAYSQVIVLDWSDTSFLTVTLAPGEQRRVVNVGSRSTHDNVYRFADIQVNQSPTEGRSVLFKDISVEIGATAGDYYTGTGDYTYAWSGTANASPSVQRATGASNWSLASLSNVFQSSVQKYSQGKSLGVVTRGGNGDGTYSPDVAITAGTTYYYSAWVKVTTSHPLTVTLRWKDSAQALISDTSFSVTPSTVGVWTRISCAATAPAGATILQPMIRIYANHTATTYYIDDVLLEASLVLGAYFDGATGASTDFTHAWTGTANASISEQRGVVVSNRIGLAPYTTAWQSGVRSRSGSKSAAVVAKLNVPAANTMWYPASEYIINTQVNANATYTWSVYVWVPSGGGTVMLVDATTNTAGTASTLYDRWERLSVTVTTPASGALFLRLRAATTVPAGTVIWVDDELLEQVPAALEFFDGANPIQNLATEPLATTYSGGSIGWRNTRWFGTNGATGNYTLVAGASDGPIPNLRTYVRKQWTVSPTHNGDTGFDHFNGTLAVSAGTTYTVSSYLRPSSAGKLFQHSFYWYDANNVLTRTVGTQIANAPAGQWSRLVTTVVVPATAVKMAIASDVQGGTGVWAVGDTLDGTGLLLEKSSTINPFYSGTGDFTYAWNGATNASTSLQRGVSVNLLGSLGATYVSAPSWGTSGKSVRISPTGPDSFVFLGSMASFVTGKTYTISATITLAAPQTGTLDNRARKIMVYHSGGFSTGTQAPNVAGSFRSSVTFTVTDSTQYTNIRLYNGASAGGGDVWWDDILVEETPVVSPYFDGTTPASGDYTHAWTGTAYASTSVQQAVAVAALAANRNTAGAFAASKFYVHQSTAEDGKKTAKWVSPAGTPDANWRIAGIVGSTSLGWDVSKVKSGGTYTLMLQYRAIGWSAGSNMSMNLADATSANAIMNVMNVSLTTVGWTQYRRVFKATRDATTASILYMSLPTTAPVAADGILEVRNWMLVEGEYTGDYVDGHSPLAKWEGTPNASTSIGYPPQLFDIAGKPAADITTTGTTVLPGGIDPTSARTLYTVAYLYNDIVTGGLDVIATYGDSAFTDTIANNYMTLRYQSEAGNTSTVLNRRSGGGGPQALGVPVGVNVICWGMRNRNLFVSHGGQPEFVDIGNVMSVDHEAVNIAGTTTQRRHIRTLVYLEEHDAATRLAMQRYLGNKYGATVA